MGTPTQISVEELISKKGVLPLWQPFSHSTHIIAKKVSEKFGVKTAHTGTLDPMAQGVIIILCGEKVLEKEKMSRGTKRYDFEIVCGFSTDTFDGMGMLVSHLTNETQLPKKEELEKVCKNLIGKYSQEYPEFSAKKILGQQMHVHKRSGSKIKHTPTKEGEISECSLTKIETTTYEECFNDIVKKISQVSGDFRQEKIISQWNKLFEVYKKIPLQKLHFNIAVSEGIYIREISQNICNKLGIIGFANNITRAKNKGYKKDDCYILEEVFGKDYWTLLDFESKTKPIRA